MAFLGVMASGVRKVGKKRTKEAGEAGTAD